MLSVAAFRRLVFQDKYLLSADDMSSDRRA
jgi:hypothetical protein